MITTEAHSPFKYAALLKITAVRPLGPPAEAKAWQRRLHAIAKKR